MSSTGSGIDVPLRAVENGRHDGDLFSSLADGRLPGLPGFTDMPAGLLDAIPVAILIADADGRLVRFNRRAAQLWGEALQPGVRLEECSALQILSAKGELLPYAETPVARALRTGVPEAERVLELGLPGGGRAVCLVNSEPLRDGQGALSGAICCFQDITHVHGGRGAPENSLPDTEDFFENGAVGLHLVAVDGTILRANQAELDLLGYTREEYVGRSIRDFHADEEVIADILARLSRGEQLDKYPARLRAKDGSIRHVLITSNVNFQSGEFVNSRCFTVDVTAWRQSQALYAEAERRLAATYEAAPLGIAEIDAEGRLVQLNGAFERIFGYSRDELLGRDFHGIVHPDPAACGGTCREQAAGSVDGSPMITRHKRRDGSEIFIRIMASAVRNEAGEVGYGVRIVEDVTERKQALDRIEESERFSRELLEALPVAIYTTDMDGRINFYNEAAVELSGRRPELHSDKWCVTWRLYHSDGTHMEHRQCPMAHALLTGEELRGIVALAERPDGARVPFMPFPKLLRNAAGEVVGAINMLVDMTERKRAEDEQRTLIDELNHRVKNTLATVQSIAAQTMRSTPENFARNFESRLMALSAAHNLLTRRRWAGVGLVELLESQLAAHGCHEGRVQLDGPEIMLDPRVGVLLGMLVHELATNAAKYGALSRPEGSVRLSWAVAPGPDGLSQAGGQRLQLLWQEQGGPAVEPPSRKGFGTRLLERSAKLDLRGRCDLRFEPAGVRCRIDIPLVQGGYAS